MMFPPIPCCTTEIWSPRTARSIAKALSSQRACIRGFAQYGGDTLKNSRGAGGFSTPKDSLTRRCGSAKRALSSTSTTDASLFTNALPKPRLGVSHETLGSYLASVYPDVAQKGAPLPSMESKEYTLVVVTESRFRRILLGRKLRGFGMGFFNSFGGHLDHAIDPTPSHGAVRELAEETNINIPLSVMKEGAVGTLRFTFEDDKEKQMIVNLFRVDLECVSDSVSIGNSKNVGANRDCSSIGRTIGGKLPAIKIDPCVISGCDEIEPQWFDNW
eukprot:CAMPEP_0185727982 /NCGR_PEP_ID=MMETSP1171-20130828/3491_1 /TAXON_ID=374046 /ORGANISM="Helicotheca tamensis, Strain CCMP826" /LENGTH=272 /DNA_ID=CAMNT_0028396631 /DNA_START=14 /DNA_END=829 /DNA_ORIENTATION=+